MKVYCIKELSDPINFNVGEICRAFRYESHFFVYNSYGIGIAFDIENSGLRLFDEYFINYKELRKRKLKKIEKYESRNIVGRSSAAKSR